jgi:ribosome-associated translation inhibitor RaiA
LVGEKMINIALDTNVIVGLYNISIGNLENLRGYSKEKFYSLKYLNEILKEDLENDKKIYLLYPPMVQEELLKGDLSCRDMACINYAKKYGEFFYISKKDEGSVNYLFELLLGRDHYYKQYLDSPVFSEGFYENNKNDCLIMCQCGVKNLQLITLNRNHFIGLYDDSIRNNIKERFNACDRYLKKFNVTCKDSYPITISEFIKEHFPQKYEKMQKEINSDHKFYKHFEKSNNNPQDKKQIEL